MLPEFPEPRPCRRRAQEQWRQRKEKWEAEILNEKGFCSGCGKYIGRGIAIHKRYCSGGN